MDLEITVGTTALFEFGAPSCNWDHNWDWVTIWVLRYHQVWGPWHPTWSLLLPVSSSGPLELEPLLLPGIRTRFFCLEKEAEARDTGGEGRGK